MISVPQTEDVFAELRLTEDQIERVQSVFLTEMDRGLDKQVSGGGGVITPADPGSDPADPADPGLGVHRR